MESRVKLHIDAIDVKLGFLTRLYLWFSGQKEEGCIPVSRFKFGGLDIEISGEIGDEVAKLQVEKGHEQLAALADFFAPYVKTTLDKYVDSLSK